MHQLGGRIVIDVTTLAIMLAIIAATLAVGMAAFWRVYRNTLPWRVWMLAILTAAIGALLLALDGAVPELLSLLAANALVTFAMGLIWNGIRQFGGRQWQWAPPLVTTLLVVLLLAWFRWGDDDPAIRALIVPLSQGAWLLALAVECWRNGVGQPRAIDHMAALLFAVLALTLEVRPVMTWLNPLLSASLPLQQIELMIITLDVILIVMCFLALSADRIQERLAATAQRAERANEAKSRFLAMMSHEIRTPMTGVVGAADLLMSVEQDQEKQGHLRALRASARNLMTLLDDILDFSRMEAGKLKVAAVATDVGAVLSEVRALFMPEAQEKGLPIELVIAPEVPRVVRVDPGRLRQVLVNLVGNALKFTARGRITLGMSCELNRDVPELVFEVTDTGIGIDEEQVSRLFQPFEQADASVGRRFGGSGLGLAICRGLADAMGGRLEVMSAPGQGSAFRLCLPAEGRAELLPAAVPAAENSAIPDRTLAPARILLVDDESTNRRLIATVLRRMGHSVEECENGPDTVQAVRTTAGSDGGFDLLLLDMRMPDMDGPATAAAIRALPEGAMLRIVGLSADAMLSERERYLAAGLDAYLTKPVDWAALEREIDRALGRAAQAVTETPASNPVAEPAPAPAVLRQSLLEELATQIGADGVARMLELFQASLAGHLERIVEAGRRQDRRALREAAHSLKGAAASLGADSLAGILRRLERCEQPEIADCLAELQGAAAETRAAMRRHGRPEA